jgi:hypothetical protein
VMIGLQANRDLLSVRFHIAFAVPVRIAATALQNKAIVCDIQLKTAGQTIHVRGAIQHLGGETGMIVILHTWADPDASYHAHRVSSGLGSDGCFRQVRDAGPI